MAALAVLSQLHIVACAAPQAAHVRPGLGHRARLRRRTNSNVISFLDSSRAAGSEAANVSTAQPQTGAERSAAGFTDAGLVFPDGTTLETCAPAPIEAMRSPARICQASCKLRNSHAGHTPRQSCTLCDLDKPAARLSRPARTCLKAVSAGQWTLSFSPARAHHVQAPFFSSCGSKKFLERVRNFFYGLR